MSYIGHGLSHAIFGGAASRAHRVAINFYVGAGLVGLRAALLIAVSRGGARSAPTLRSASITSASFAIGIAIISAIGTFTATSRRLLFGNVLGVTRPTSSWSRRSRSRRAVVVFLRYRQLLFTTFDPEVAEVSGVRTGRIDALLALMLAATIAVTMRVVGVTLIAAMLVIPPVMARLLTDSFRRMLWISVVAGAVCGFVGVYLSYYLDWSSGATVVLTAAFLFAIAYAGRRAPAAGPLSPAGAGCDCGRATRRRAAVGAQPRDREVREVGLEPVVALDQVQPGVASSSRAVVAAAPLAREVHVLGLVGLVVLGAGLEVGVLEHADLLEQGERAVDGRGVHARHLALHLAGDHAGEMWPVGAHHLGDDGTALRRHAQAAAPAAGPSRRCSRARFAPRMDLAARCRCKEPGRRRPALKDRGPRGSGGTARCPWSGGTGRSGSVDRAGRPSACRPGASPPLVERPHVGRPMCRVPASRSSRRARRCGDRRIVRGPLGRRSPSACRLGSQAATSTGCPRPRSSSRSTPPCRRGGRGCRCGRRMQQASPSKFAPAAASGLGRWRSSHAAEHMPSPRNGSGSATSGQASSANCAAAIRQAGRRLALGDLSRPRSTAARGVQGGGHVASERSSSTNRAVPVVVPPRNVGRSRRRQVEEVLVPDPRSHVVGDRDLHEAVARPAS